MTNIAGNAISYGNKLGAMMLRKWGTLVFGLLAAIFLAIIAVTPSTPKDSSAPSSQFSSERAMADIRIIAAKPHPTGSVENAKIRAYILDRMKTLGMETSVHESQLSPGGLDRLNRWSGENNTEKTIYNLIGVLPGQDRSKPPLLLMAHHDTVWDSPGASDDTIGVASILEIIRAIKQDKTPARDVVVLITDAEELGLIGAQNFFDQHPLKDKIGAIINFEARGGGGTANMFQTSADNGEAARLYARSVREPSASSLSVFVYNLLPNDTDLTPALEHDYTAYNIAHLGRAGYYHSPKMDADALDQGTVQHMGSQGLDLTRALIHAENLPAKAPDATFFDLFGLFTIAYSPFWGWIFIAIGALGFGLSVQGTIKRKTIFSGFTKMAGYLVLGGTLLFALNKLSGNGSQANYYDRLAAIPRLEVIALLTCIAVFFLCFGTHKTTNNDKDPNLILGAAIPIFLIGIIGQALAPTATYFISLPLFLAGLTAFALHRSQSNFIGQSIAAISLILIAGYMLGLGHLLLLGVGPNFLFVAILPAAIAVLAILPYPSLARKPRYVVASFCLLTALIVAIWIRVDPMAATVPAYRVW